jgi:hypothetical protein
LNGAALSAAHWFLTSMFAGWWKFAGAAKQISGGVRYRFHANQRNFAPCLGQARCVLRQAQHEGQ